MLVLPALAVVAALALASDAQVRPNCAAAFGDNSILALQGFGLTTLNRTTGNPNTTGVPLVLGQGGAITGASLKVLSVRARRTRLMRVLSSGS